MELWFMHPYDIIKKAADQSGNGSVQRKKDIISAHMHDNNLIKAVKYALDPWMQFYTTTVPGLASIASKNRHKEKDLKAGIVDLFDHSGLSPLPKQLFAMFDLLDKLSSKSLPPNSSQSRNAIIEWAKTASPSTVSLFRLILNKDLRCGMKAASFNKIKKGWIPEFKVQLAQPFNEKKITYPCYVDPKFDGERCLAFISASNGNVTYMSRNGNQFNNFGCFDKQLLKLFRSLGDVVIDSEVISQKGFQTLMKVPKDYDPNFNASQLQLVVFDIIPQQAFESSNYNESQEKRYQAIGSIFRGVKTTNIIPCNTRIAHSFKEVEKIFEYWVGKGLEGIICKNIEGDYEFKRSSNWIKIKGTLSNEFRVVDLEMGRPGKRWEGKAGSIIIEKTDKNGNSIRVGVASGLTDYHHENLTKTDDGQIMYRSPEGKLININGKLVEVMFDCETEDGSLRFPRLKPTSSIVRTDK